MLDLIPIAAVWASVVLNYSWCGVRLDQRRRKSRNQSLFDCPLFLPSPIPPLGEEVVLHMPTALARGYIPEKMGRPITGIQVPGPAKTKQNKTKPLLTYNAASKVDHRFSYLL